MMVVLMGIGTAFAQISTGEPNSSVIPRTGNRPQAADFGMYLGASVTQIIDLANNNKGNDVFWALPVINLKYYVRDNLEVRMGFQFACSGKDSVVSARDVQIGKTTMASTKNYTRFLPGLAYHFNTSNIIDVYVGAQMPVGFDVEVSKSAYNAYNGVPDYKYTETFRKGDFVIGGGVFLGLQFFVADLPFAIGVEGGYSGRAVIGNGDGMTYVNDDGNKYKYYGEGSDGLKLRSSVFMSGSWGADAALTFTYYFRK